MSVENVRNFNMNTIYWNLQSQLSIKCAIFAWNGDGRLLRISNSIRTFKAVVQATNNGEATRVVNGFSNMLRRYLTYLEPRYRRYCLSSVSVLTEQYL